MGVISKEVEDEGEGGWGAREVDVTRFSMLNLTYSLLKNESHFTLNISTKQFSVDFEPMSDSTDIEFENVVWIFASCGFRDD